MMVEGTLKPRDVEGTKNLAVDGVVHDGGGTGPGLDPDTEVFTGMHLHRPPG